MPLAHCFFALQKLLDLTLILSKLTIEQEIKMHLKSTALFLLTFATFTVSASTGLNDPDNNKPITNGRFETILFNLCSDPNIRGEEDQTKLKENVTTQIIDQRSNLISKIAKFKLDADERKLLESFVTRDKTIELSSDHCIANTRKKYWSSIK